MATLTIDNSLNDRLASAAKMQGKTADQMLTHLIVEYLQDLDDAHLAEATLQRLESGETHLIDWQEAKRQLHDMEH